LQLSALQVCYKDTYLYITIGAGKTTLLNFLSGREISQNLVKEGTITVNGKIKEELANFSSYSAYVQ
jgi:ABC-type multidrug transport system ATPase subunit